MRKLNSILEQNKSRSNFYLSEISVKKEPSTKIRDSYKRRRVIAIEIAVMSRNFDPSKFTLVKPGVFKCNR